MTRASGQRTDHKLADGHGYHGRRWVWRSVLLVAMFGLALALSLGLVWLGVPGVSPDREYTSAIFARSFYLADRSDVPGWQRDIARRTRHNQPTLELPITEWLASLAYRLFGREDIRLARTLTVLFWMVGGLVLLQIARSLLGHDAAILAVGYYLYLPASIELSRSFQPEPLMIVLFLASVFCTIRYYETSTRRRLLTAAIVAAAAVLYRPLVMPPIVASFLLPAIQRDGMWRGSFGKPVVVYLPIALVPALAYYGYGTFIADYFRWKIESSFMFSLYARREYWQGWLEYAIGYVGFTPLLLACAGLAWVRSELGRTVVLGLALGYVCFGLTFTLHIHTHGYYQAQLIPVVALAAAPVVTILMRRIMEATDFRVQIVSSIATAALVTVLWMLEMRASIREPLHEDPATATAIGEATGHSDRVVFVSRHYGLPLQYYAQITGTFWPRRIPYWLYRIRPDHRYLLAKANPVLVVPEQDSTGGQRCRTHRSPRFSTRIFRNYALPRVRSTSRGPTPVP